jgi:hypothetical protein
MRNFILFYGISQPRGDAPRQGASSPFFNLGASRYPAQRLPPGKRYSDSPLVTRPDPCRSGAGNCLTTRSDPCDLSPLEYYSAIWNL